jgi:hypothetical protein
MVREIIFAPGAGILVSGVLSYPAPFSVALHSSQSSRFSRLEIAQVV